MHIRFPLAALAAALVTFSLLFAMQSLVSIEADPVDDAKSNWQFDFVRLKRAEQVARKERKKPQKVDRPAPPPQATPSSQEDIAPLMDVDIALESAALDLNLGPGLGTGADSDIVPMVRVNPQYPSRAAARGIEGWVLVRFTVTAQGTTKDIEVLDADPRGYFETASKSAVKRYKYRPQVRDGKAVEHPGVEVVLTFKLEK